MTGGQLAMLIRRLRRASDTGQPGGLDDADLLRRFVAGRDEAAFEVLLWRHAAMVLNVCRRVLRHEQDAEDAFQATFLTLARKAGSVVRHASVGGWLYRVAYRVALAARERRARQAPWQALDQDVPSRDGESDPIWRDLRPVLDEEVGRLPERQRLAFVLCYLQGKTNAEAARKLGVPEGTVASRLSMARRLRARLTRRGLTLPAAALAAVLAARAAPAAVAPALVALTLRTVLSFTGGKGAAPATATTAAIALTEGVLRAMWITKLKLAFAVLLAVGVVGGGAGLLAYRLGAAEPPARSVRQAAAAPRGPAERPVKEAAAESGKQAAPARPAAEEQDKRLTEARMRVMELDANFRKQEEVWSEERLQARVDVLSREQGLQAIQRRRDLQHRRQQVRINVAERRLAESLERKDSEKVATLEKELDELYEKSQADDDKDGAESLRLRLELLKAREKLQLLEGQQAVGRERIRADLEAAEAKVRWLRGDGPDPSARGGDLDRKLETLLHELDEVRGELRQRNPPRDSPRDE